jgi:hypothetical protein
MKEVKCLSVFFGTVWWYLEFLELLLLLVELFGGEQALLFQRADELIVLPAGLCVHIDLSDESIL